MGHALPKLVYLYDVQMPQSWTDLIAILCCGSQGSSVG